MTPSPGGKAPTASAEMIAMDPCVAAARAMVSSVLSTEIGLRSSPRKTSRFDLRREQRRIHAEDHRRQPAELR